MGEFCLQHFLFLLPLNCQNVTTIKVKGKDRWGRRRSDTQISLLFPLPHSFWLVLCVSHIRSSELMTVRAAPDGVLLEMVDVDGTQPEENTWESVSISKETFYMVEKWLSVMSYHVSLLCKHWSNVLRISSQHFFVLNNITMTSHPWAEMHICLHLHIY